MAWTVIVVNTSQVFRYEHSEFLAKHLLCAVSKCQLSRGIHKQNRAVFINRYYCVGRGFGDRAIAFLALPQCFFLTFAIGDISCKYQSRTAAVEDYLSRDIV